MLLVIYLSGSIGIFSSVFIDFHRSSFQSFVSEYYQPNAEKLIFSKFDFNQLEWKERGREFEWNNRLYDVSEIHIAESGVEITCVNDSEEESLVAFFSEWKKSTYPGIKIKIQCQPQFCVERFFIGEFSSKEQHTYFIVQRPLSATRAECYPPPEHS